MTLLIWILVGIYVAAAAVLMLYGLNCYLMVYLLLKSSKKSHEDHQAIWRQFNDFKAWPRIPQVTTQLPIYNEYNVVHKLLQACCELDYPKGYHRIQILDDSDDETRTLLDDLVHDAREQGHLIELIRRKDRQGYKAGALAAGLNETEDGEFLAIFDADFVPPKDFLLKTIPFFLANDRVGLVQTRWGHLNERESALTRAQSMGIDGHFAVDQAARCWNHLFMNFNGTAGLWRRSAITDGGGWQADTLTEDMDLSYRVMLRGWQAEYLPEVVVPAELPATVTAFKSQQYRWAKGSIQTAIKLLPRVLASTQHTPFAKFQAVMHMTHYLIHPAMLISALLALPVLLYQPITWTLPVIAGTSLCFLAGVAGPNCLYITSMVMLYADWRRRMLYIPLLMIIGVGLAVSNTRAVLSALYQKGGEFVRTPKRGERCQKIYSAKGLWLAFPEILLGLYCLASLTQYCQANKYMIGPFLGLYAVGFLSMGLMTLRQISGRVS